VFFFVRLFGSLECISGEGPTWTGFFALVEAVNGSSRG
jgi:hypothetical protein